MGLGPQGSSAGRSALGHRAGNRQPTDAGSLLLITRVPVYGSALSKLTLVGLQAVPPVHEGNLARVLSEF